MADFTQCQLGTTAELIIFQLCSSLVEIEANKWISENNWQWFVCGMVSPLAGTLPASYLLASELMLCSPTHHTGSPWNISQGTFHFKAIFQTHRHSHTSTYTITKHNILTFVASWSPAKDQRQTNRTHVNFIPISFPWIQESANCYNSPGQSWLLLHSWCYSNK